MSFGVPEWLWGLLLIPLLIALFLRAERRGHRRLQEFVSARLLPQLAATANRPRRVTRFALQLLAIALALVSLAQPRWGYTFEDVKRKGLDLLIAVDTSRSMLSNDVQPSRLDRVKLAVQDLINELQGDRVGLIAFAGRAFLQAPLTIDYDAVVEAINDLDTKTIPEGGTNISSAIVLATQSFGKSATGNRALIIFTDGEELSGDAVKTAKEAADAGVRIFTVGVGTPQGSLIPVTGDDGQTAFVKDSAGQVVKSKLDDKRLREIAQATGGFYVHLESGPRTMQQIQNEGLAKMQAAEMDVRLSRRPIERYEWPLSAALIALTLSILIPERKRARERRTIRAPTRNAAHAVASGPVRTAVTTAALLILVASFSYAAAPGIDAYRDGKFEDAYSQFQQTLKSQALLTRDTGLQSKGHYNLGNTLYQHGETEKSDDKKLSDWTNALDHYEQTLKLNPQNKDAKDNYDYVKRKIEELKNKKSQQQPSPSPSPSPQKNKQNQKNKQDQQQKQNQDQQQQQSQQNQKQEKQQQQQNEQQQQGQGQEEKKDQQQQSQDQQSQDKSRSDKEQKQEKQKEQAQAKNEPQKKQQEQPGESPSPSAGTEKQQAGQPSPSPGERQAEESPTPGEGENEMPSPSPGEGEDQNGSEGGDENASPSATPAESPEKKFAGEVKGAGEDKSQKPPDKNAQIAEAEPEKEGQMSERQALALLESMKDEEARVQLDERKVRRRVYNDW